MQLNLFSSSYSTIVLSSILLLSPINAILGQTDPVVFAQNNQLNLLTYGSGTWTKGGRTPNNISSASVILQSNNRAQVILFLTTNQTIRLEGDFTRQTPQQVRINFTNSGPADAKGAMLLEYRNNNIVLLNGQGSLDGQSFRAVFRGDQANASTPNAQTLSIQQSGEGLFNLQSRPNQNITAVFITVDAQKKAKVSLMLKNGNTLNFDGVQAGRDAYTLRIQVNRSGMANATGFFNIEVGAGNSINHLIGQGTLDGQNFLVNFR